MSGGGSCGPCGGPSVCHTFRILYIQIRNGHTAYTRIQHNYFVQTRDGKMTKFFGPARPVVPFAGPARPVIQFLILGPFGPVLGPFWAPPKAVKFNVLNYDY